MKTIQARLSLWRTEITQLVGLLLFVGIVELIVALTNPTLSGGWLLIVSVALALIPATLWLSVFYVQDRSEPEPRSFVIGVAVLGGLLAGAIGQPLLTRVFDVSSWITHDTLTQILGSILVIGFTQEFLKYAAIRYSIFYSREFDRRMDGVVYGSAAGLGYAAMLNIIMVMSTGGFDLATGVIRIVVVQMVHGSLGALLGYFLGRDKFDPKRVWWMPLGLVIAATLDGLFSWAGGELSQSSIKFAAGAGRLGYNPWPQLLLATALAACLLAAIFYLIRLDLRADAKAAPAVIPPPTAPPPAEPAIPKPPAPSAAPAESLLSSTVPIATPSGDGKEEKAVEEAKGAEKELTGKGTR